MVNLSLAWRLNCVCIIMRAARTYQMSLGFFIVFGAVLLLRCLVFAPMGHWMYRMFVAMHTKSVWSLFNKIGVHLPLAAFIRHDVQSICHHLKWRLAAASQPENVHLFNIPSMNIWETTTDKSTHCGLTTGHYMSIKRSQSVILIRNICSTPVWRVLSEIRDRAFFYLVASMPLNSICGSPSIKWRFGGPKDLFWELKHAHCTQHTFSWFISARNFVSGLTFQSETLHFKSSHGVTGRCCMWICLQKMHRAGWKQSFRYRQHCVNSESTIATKNAKSSQLQKMHQIRCKKKFKHVYWIALLSIFLKGHHGSEWTPVHKLYANNTSWAPRSTNRSICLLRMGFP